MGHLQAKSSGESVKSWVQTPRAAHHAFERLIEQHANAARLMHFLVANIENHNAVVISQKALAQRLRLSERTIRNAIRVLVEGNWIEVRRIGPHGTVNAYVLNDRVAWFGPRDGMRFSLFSAHVFVFENDQSDRDDLAELPPLRRAPRLPRDLAGGEEG